MANSYFGYEDFDAWKNKATLLDDVFFNMAIKQFPELINLLIETFTPFKADVFESSVADYKESELGLRFEFDSLSVDKDGNRFILEMQKVYDGFIGERILSYADATALKMLREQDLKMQPLSDVETDEEKEKRYTNLYSILHSSKIVAIVFLNKIPQSLREIGVGSNGDPVYTYCGRDDKGAVFPSYPVVFIVDVNDDKGNDVRAQVLRDLKESDPAKVETKLIRAILYYYKSSWEGKDNMGTTYQRLIEKGKAAGRVEGRAEGVNQTTKALSQSKSLDEIIDKTNLSKEEIKEIMDNLYSMFTHV